MESALGSVNKSAEYDVVIVGSGFAGSVVAREMAEDGKRVLLIEKRSHIGGNMYDAVNSRGIMVHRYGPHILHTRSNEVFAWLSRFSKWDRYEHRVLCVIGNRLVPIPFNFTSIEMLFPEPKAHRLCAKLKSAFPLSGRVAVQDLMNSADYEITELGMYIFRNVFVRYSEKQWGVPIDRVDSAALRRVPVVIGYDGRYFDDDIQVMPREGYARLIENILSHQNITCHLNQQAESVLHLESPGRVFFDGNIFTGFVVYTGTPDVLLNYQYGHLPYRSLRLRFESYARTEFQAAPVVNYPNQAKYTRITEFKKLTGQRHDGVTTILREYPVACDNSDCEPYYPIENHANRSLYETYQRALASWENLYLCGRLAEYRYYNMDIVIERALDLSQTLKQRASQYRTV